MQTVFIEGGLIRQLWSIETHAYRDHLLRLDLECRRNRFNGTIADDTVRGYWMRLAEQARDEATFARDTRTRSMLVGFATAYEILAQRARIRWDQRSLDSRGVRSVEARRRSSLALSSLEL